VSAHVPSTAGAAADGVSAPNARGRPGGVALAPVCQIVQAAETAARVQWQA
jgi:hypothetical protein